MRCRYCKEVLFKDDLPKTKHEASCGMNPKFGNKEGSDMKPCKYSYIKDFGDIKILWCREKDDECGKMYCPLVKR